MTLSTIQPIGKKPVTSPSTEARRASGAGMVKAQMAIQIAATSAITAAMCAFTLPEAMSANNTTTGMAATSVDNHSLPSGLYTWFHIVLFLPRGALLQGKITGCGWTVTMAGPILGRYFSYAHSARNLPPRPHPRGHRPGQCHPAGVRG